MKKDLLVVFAKEPVSGQVKTRLGKNLGMKSASVLYDLMFRNIIENLTSMKVYDLIIYKTRQSSKTYFNKAAKDIIVKDQPEGDLGQKMLGVFKQEFARTYERICIIGSDCPDISNTDIQNAFQMLKTCGLVLGPSKDGGYYLIGLSGLYPQLFGSIAWSTVSVFSKTLEIAESYGIKYKLLSLKTDIDEITDLEKYINKTPETKLALAFKEIIRESAGYKTPPYCEGGILDPATDDKVKI